MSKKKDDQEIDAVAGQETTGAEKTEETPEDTAKVTEEKSGENAGEGRKAEPENTDKKSPKNDKEEKTAVAVAESEKSVRCYAIKDHECVIGKTSVNIVKDGSYNFPSSVVTILQNAGVVIKK